MFLLVSKFKMIGMLLNIVHGQVLKKANKNITKESYGFHNLSNLKCFDRMHFHLKERACMIFYNHYLKMASCPKKLPELQC